MLTCNERLTAPPGSLEALSDPVLAARVETALSNLTPRARAFSLAVASGKSYTIAATEAGLSTNRVSILRLKRRTEWALRLLREQTRRASMLTLEVAVQRFRKLSDEARAKGDYSAAARALREACLLLNLYPSEKIDITHRVNLGEVSEQEWLALAQLRHQVRQALPAATIVTDAEVVSIPTAEALPASSEAG
jgi:hypothetical protein